ncbi:hypothetical protein DY000_02007204 [Brassica cretica]|uniref:Uncharacterized protein n=1 Tax=Brassica cretica TaxID=69181 RepID=A0ABQ7CF79_BRACR|nr:hypothetical protein DY000_02007204 [Brassica cretica]
MASSLLENNSSRFVVFYIVDPSTLNLLQMLRAWFSSQRVRFSDSSWLSFSALCSSCLECSSSYSFKLWTSEESSGYSTTSSRALCSSVARSAHPPPLSHSLDYSPPSAKLLGDFCVGSLTEFPFYAGRLHRGFFGIFGNMEESPYQNISFSGSVRKDDPGVYKGSSADFRTRKMNPELLVFPSSVCMEPAQHGDQDILNNSTEVHPSDRTNQTNRAVYRINPRMSGMEFRLEPRTDNRNNRTRTHISRPSRHSEDNSRARLSLGREEPKDGNAFSPGGPLGQSRVCPSPYRRRITFSSPIPSWGDVLEADSEEVPKAPLRRRRSCFFDDGPRSEIREGDLADIRRKYAIHPSVGIRSLPSLSVP